MIQLTRKEFNALGRVFAHEIGQAFEWSLYPFQSKAKIFRKLADDGLLSDVRQVKLPVRPVPPHFLAKSLPVSVSGYMLTEAGRMAYCTNVERFATPEELAESEEEMKRHDD